MFTGNSDAAWERYGKRDPYFGVCTEDEYRAENLDEAAFERFFRSGEEHVGSVLEEIRGHLADDFSPRRALDFGCGVGRLTIPLARVCPQVVGVDVSPGMLAEAKKNCFRAGVTNVELASPEDGLRYVPGTFDFVLSYSVFQHIPPRRGQALLENIIDRLQPDGIGALHFTYHRKASRARYVMHWARKHVPYIHNSVNWIQGKPFSYPLMQWNNYDLNRIYLALQERGCGRSCVRFTDHGGGHLGVYVFFQKRALPGL